MDAIFSGLSDFYQKKELKIGDNVLRQIEHFIYLQVIDRRWKEHLQAMDHLREGIHFRGYAQKDPKQEYKKEGFFIFSAMMTAIRDEVLEKVFKVELKQESSEQARDELNALQQRQRELAEKQKQRQVLGRGTSGTQKRKTDNEQAPDMANLKSQQQVDEEGKLNRHQRRMIKKFSKKDQKQTVKR